MSLRSSHVLLLVCICIVFSRCVGEEHNNGGTYTDFDWGSYYYSQKKRDSAFLMYNRYVSKADDSLKKGKAYRYMGDMLWEAGDLYGAEENATGAIRTLDPMDTAHYSELGYAYNLLGNVYQDIQHYDDAIRMYNKAKEFSKNAGFFSDLINGEAVALQKKGKYEDAIALYDSMLLLNPADRSVVARIIDNRAKTKWLQDPGYPALPEFWHALKIRVDSQYNRGLNASYAHLADYYAESNRDSALWYANKMFHQAQIIQSPDDRLEAIDKLIRLDNASALQHWYAEFKRLSDSTRLSRDTTRSRYALIRYDSQKSKADNLELKGHVIRQRLWMFGLIVLAIGIISGLSAWYNKRRKRIKQEAEISIRDAKLKTSQKVHDVVANELYGIMNELEHGKEIERESLTTRIEGLYEKSRDISYEEASYADDGDYDKQIHALLNDFTKGKTKVFVVGNQQIFWDKVTGFQKNELLLILREIMINMKKHSGANNVVIRFKEENKTGYIYYSDNGKGFPSDTEFGNGLNNTVNRIKSLNGQINFGKSDKGGASIVISFPLQSSKT